MERWGDKGTAAARARRLADQPSFSSTLLDAIYKSMEDDPGHAGEEAAATKKKKQQQQQDALHYSNYYRPSLAGSYRARAPAPAHATTSSSSECSSYGGFSSSEAESSNHRRLRPIRTTVSGGGGAPTAAPAPEKKAKKPAGASIRAKLRDLRGKPASPGARLAGFLNIIFAGKPRAPQTPPSARTAAAAAEYACSSASSYSRSCLSKTPSTRGQQANRTVRFMESDGEALSTAPGRVDRRRVPVQAVEQMLLRRMEMESDEDDDDEEDEESSDASSDLFELENLAAVAPPGAGAGYRDELPVYETTRVVLNRGIGHGHGRSARVV